MVTVSGTITLIGLAMVVLPQHVWDKKVEKVKEKIV